MARQQCGSPVYNGTQRQVADSESRRYSHALVDERVTGSIRESYLWVEHPEPNCSKAALLEFIPTAAWTGVVSPDAFERILKALAACTISLCLPSPSLLILAVLLGEAVPFRQLVYGVAE